MDVIKYIGIGDNAGKIIDAEEALEYAAARCGIRIIDPDAPEVEAFCEMFEEWYFSDDWILDPLESDQDIPDLIFRRFKIISPGQWPALQKLLNRKHLTRADLLLILSVIQSTDGGKYLTDSESNS